jgi:hypothetical protein
MMLRDIQAWRPYLRKDIDLLEGVQRRATKMIPSLKFKSYEDRLNELELTTLETRRLRRKKKQEKNINKRSYKSLYFTYVPRDS